jgi:hypothetical protein
LIKLKNILKEISEIEADRLLNKIKNKEYSFLAQGDNGKVYAINGEDLLFKITTEPDEKAVADVIVGRAEQFNSFIPVHYSDPKSSMYIMNKANPLSPKEQEEITRFYNGYKNFLRQAGPDASIFDYLDTEETRSYSVTLINFMRALQQHVRKTNIGDLHLSLDFKPDNIMKWNGNLVMIDW